MYSVIFVEPESPGNVGALARAMANFGLKELILVNPCEFTDETSGRAKHAYNIVENARILDSFEKAIKGFDFVVGTTGKTTTNYDEIRTSYTPKELSENLKKIEGKIALVFGREGIGLTNEELAKCDTVITIQTSRQYPILNITHAAVIIFYELLSLPASKVRKANLAEKEILFRYFDEIAEGLPEIRDPEVMGKVFGNVINRSTIAGREATTLAGFFKEVKNNLKPGKSKKS